MLIRMLLPTKLPRATLWTAFLVTAVLLALFWRVILADHRFAFRDASHFYLPLYEYLAPRLAAGALPLWNPLDQTGVPVAGEASTALFYPMTVLFWVGLSTAHALSAYVLLHLAIAAAGAWCLARTVGIRPSAASLAALGYAFSTPVLFLYCNPPFLVGAALLPWQLFGLWHAIRNPSIRGVAFAAVPAALSILAGDPQTVAHAWLLTAAALVGAPLRRLALDRKQRGRGSWMLALQRLSVLGGVATIAIAAAMVQVWPAAAWAQHSWRSASPPPTLYSEAGELALETTSPPRSWWQTPPPGTHAAAIYRFSVAPWHYLTLVVPNLYGNLFPTNGRWSGGIPGEPAMWTPSCYCGILVALGALAGFTPVRFRSSLTRAAVSFCRFSIIISILAALGEFGLVRASQTLTDSDLGDANGAVLGLYWLLVTFVPFYATFRYPAKWLVPLALALALLAAAVVDSPHTRRQLARLTLGMLIVLSALAALALSPVAAALLQPIADAAPADEFWGPVTLAASLRVVRMGVVGAAITCALVLVVVLRARWQPATRAALLAAILAVDLMFANTPLIATVPIDERAFDQSALPVNPSGALAEQLSGRRVVTAYDRDDWPDVWRTSSSQNRIQAVELSQRRALFARWHLAQGIGQLDSVPSLVPVRNRLFLRAAAAAGLLSGRQACDAAARQRFQNISGTSAQVRLTAPASVLPAALPASPVPTVIIDACDRAADALLYDRWREIPPLQNSELSRAAKELLGDADEAPLNLPLVERKSSGDEQNDAKRDFDKSSGASSAATARPVVAVRSGPEAAEYRVATSAPVLLYRPTYQDGYWTAYLRSDDQPWQQLDVHRANIIGQSVVLPAGRWHVRFEYVPTWLFPASATSLLTWVFIAGTLIKARGPRFGRVAKKKVRVADSTCQQSSSAGNR